MNTSLKTTFLSLVILFLPLTSVLAQGSPGSAEAMDFVSRLNNIILFPLIALLLAVAFFVFIIGCVQYIIGANNPSAREQGVKHITYGIIGLVIMVSAWTILSIAAGTFGLQNDLQNAQNGTIPAGGSVPSIPGGGDGSVPSIPGG